MWSPHSQRVNYCPPSNTIPAVLMMGAAVMSFHYNSVFSIIRYHLHLALRELAKLFLFDVHLRSLGYTSSIFTNTALCNTMPIIVQNAQFHLELMTPLIPMNWQNCYCPSRTGQLWDVAATNPGLPPLLRQTFPSRTRPQGLCKHSCTLCSMVSSIGKQTTVRLQLQNRVLCKQYVPTASHVAM